MHKMGIAYHIDECWVCKHARSSQRQLHICDDCYSKGFRENKTSPKGILDAMLHWRPYRMSKKYGNDDAWCFLEDGWDAARPIEVWHNLGNGEEEVMAHATDKYNAMQIVDALIVADKVNDDPENKLTKHEIVFLQFVESNCCEPWSTNAANAILWNDRDAYKVLKAKFSEIY